MNKKVEKDDLKVEVVSGEQKPRVVLQPEVEEKVKEDEQPTLTSDLTASIDSLAKIVEKGEKEAGEKSPAEIKLEDVKGKVASDPMKVVWAFVGLMIGVSLGIMVGYGVWKGNWQDWVSGLPKLQAGMEKISVTPAPTVAVSPTPVLNREVLKVKVLNGTGGAGVAAAGKQYLEGLGYKDVQIGNAKSSDYSTSEVVLASDKLNLWEAIKGDLENKYVVSDSPASDDALLQESGNVDMLLIVGAK